MLGKQVPTYGFLRVLGVPGVPGVLGVPGAERSGAVWEQSRKHTNKQSDKQKGKRRKRKTHKHSIKKMINQANSQTSTPSIPPNEKQRKKTSKTQRRNLILKNEQLPIDRPRRLLCKPHIYRVFHEEPKFHVKNKQN